MIFLPRNPFRRTPPPPPGVSDVTCYRCGKKIGSNLSECPFCHAPTQPAPPNYTGTTAPPNTAQNMPAPPPDFTTPRGQTLCRSCNFLYNKSLKKCPNCGYPNLHYRKPTPLRESAGKRVHGKVYEIFMFEIAGILSLFIPPIFALPSLTWLAVALMTFIPLYSVLPAEHDVLNSLRTGQDLGLGASSGALMLKSISKIIAFAFIIFQFYVSFFAFRIICVAVSFLFYFSMKTRYKTSQPYNMIEAWLRMVLGGFIAVILMMTFGGMGPSSMAGAVFLFLGFAFFCTFPVHINDEENGVININLSEQTQRSMQLIDKVFFLGLMLMAFSFFLGMTGGGWGIDRIMFYAFFGLSFFVGLSTGPEGRPVLGIVMIFIFMFVLTSSYPGYVGNAVFGYWWPQIQSFGNTYLGPLNTAWIQAQQGLSDSWEMMTCPQCYFIKQQQKQQVTKSVITTGGTPMSIEINRFQLTPTILEPSEPVVGVMDLQNSGDFISGRMALDIWATYTNPINQKAYPLGKVNELKCSVAATGPPYSILTDFNGSAYSATAGSCSWDTITYPTERRSVTFIMDQGSAWGPLYSACQDNSNSSAPLACFCFGDSMTFGLPYEPCHLELANTTYYFAGNVVNVNANLTYEYVVNVSLPISVIGFNEYLNELQAGEITLQDFTSEYTGGPAKATLFTQSQPARNDIPFIVVAAIYNDGPGEILNITDFKIKVYGGNVVNNVWIVAYDFRKNAPTTSNSAPNGCDAVDSTSDPGNYIITCHNGNWKSLKSGEYKRVSFYVNASDGITDRRTTLIVGQADYNYRKTTSQALTMAVAPPQ